MQQSPDSPFPASSTICIHDPRVVERNKVKQINGLEVRDAINVCGAPGEGRKVVATVAVAPVRGSGHAEEVQRGERGQGGHLGVQGAKPRGTYSDE